MHTKGIHMEIGSTRFIALALLPCMVAACGSSDSKPRPTATPTAIPTATFTATAPPTATAVPSNTPLPSSTSTSAPTATATSVPTATATNTPSIADELNAVGLGKYLSITPPASMTPGPTWDAYVYDPAAQQAICLRGDPYQVEVHHGT